MSKKDFFTTPDKYLLSAVSDTPDIRDRMYEPALVKLEPEIIPSQALTILDQGQEGACTGFGLAAVINLLNQRRGNNICVSSRMLYEMAKKFDEWPGEGYSGSSCRGAIRGWFNMGVCSEDTWPYRVNDPSGLTFERAREARSNTIGAYYRLRPDIVDFHAALNEAGVLYASATVHSGWWKDSITNDGVIPFVREETGGHAFAIVGYNKDGFWIQNSWGEDWGKNGRALWRYEDWQENIKDAWVVRLALPTPQIWHRSSKTSAYFSEEEKGFFKKVNRAKIAGHFVHVDDGEFHDSGKYWSNHFDVKQTAKFLAKTDEFDHLLFYAHGGLNSTKASANRISALKDIFKTNRIYPYHFMYDTGLAEELKDVIFGKKTKTIERVGDFFDWSDKKIELLTRKAGKALWREMKQGAERPFDNSRAGFQVIKELVKAVQKNGRDIKIHVAGHSTGAILMAYFLKSARKMFPKMRVATCSLMAPACTTDLFNSHYRPQVEGAKTSFGIDQMTIYNLDEDLEEKDNVAFVYRKSLLYLVSRAFEEKPVAPILGMKMYSKEITLQRNAASLKIVYSNGKKTPTAKTASVSHGGFDNDPATMNDILKRIIKKTPARSFTEKDLKY